MSEGRYWKLVLNMAWAFLIVVCIVLLIVFERAQRRAQCQNGEDPGIEQEFEDGLRMNCDDL